jgi:hypothetical protein
MFHLDVAKVDLVLHMLQWLYTYASTVCFSCFKRMLQVFYLDVAYIAVAIHVCYKCMYQMFHLFQTYVASVLSGCCICFRHTLRASIQIVSSVSEVGCKCVSLDVVVVVHICCKRMFVNVSYVLDVYCISVSCYNIIRRRKRAHAEAVSVGVAVPTCVGSEAGMGGPHLHAHQQAFGV